MLKTSPQIKQNKLVYFFLTGFLSLFLLPTADVECAEVYYLGGAEPGGSGEVQNFPHYSLQQRAKDLFDFGAFGDHGRDRSGQISGNIMTQVDWRNISGNKSKSFYEEGVDYLTESNLNLQEKLWRNYQLEGRMSFRKTDDRRIEPRRDVRLKYLNTRISNPDNLLEFGDFYGEFSEFVLGESLEGFRADLKPFKEHKIQGIMARKYEDDIVADRYQRNVLGGKYDFTPVTDSGIISLFRIGTQVVTVQDDSSTKSGSTNTPDLNNTVTALDGDINFQKYLTFNYEIARSWYQPDESKFGDGDLRHGLGLRLMPTLNFGDKVMLRYLFYNVTPNFYTEVGSAMADKKQHQFNLDFIFNSRLRLSLVENWYWDHLKKSTQVYRTTNDEKYASLYIRPLESRRDLYLRPYVSYLVRTSDDPPSVIDTKTTTTGFSVSDVLWETTVSLRYEYRSDQNEVTRSSSTYFNRYGLMLAREMQIFKRRLYVSTDLSVDNRNARPEEDDDLTTGVTLDAQYDLLSNLALRLGYNIQEYNAAAADSGYFNVRNFFELDFLAHRKRGTHLISRVERNVYQHEDGTQSYQELRAVSKMASQF